MANVFSTVKNGIIHFFHSTTAGKAIEHVGIDIISLPGFHDAWTMFKTDVESQVKAAVVGLTTNADVRAAMTTLVQKVEADGKAAVASGLLGSFHGSWANFLVSAAYMVAKTELPNLLVLL